MTTTLAAIAAIVALVAGIFLKGRADGKNAIKAKEAKENEKLIKTIAEVNRAGNNSTSGKLRDSDGYKRS